MKWRKLGQIFDPTEHALPNGCREYAQSPQALVFDDFVRIYFSTRERDASGKFLSHVAYVDMAKGSWKVIGVARKTVIALGVLGSFDEHGIFPMNVLRHGKRIYAYTCGWSRRVSVSVETSIGLAFSDDDGVTFQKTGDGPIVSSSLREPFLVGDAFVQVHDGTFHMWYIFGTSWRKFDPDAPPDRTYKIGHAVSRDGVAWAREEGRRIIPDSLGADESQALPTVVRAAGRHHMIFCYRHSSDFRKNAARGYRLGYASSTDLVDWSRDDASIGIGVSESGWDSEMMCYPHLFECDGDVYLLYNGNEFGRRGFGIARLE